MTQTFDYSAISPDGKNWIDDLIQHDPSFPNADPHEMSEDERDSLSAYLRGEDGGLDSSQQAFSASVADEIDALGGTPVYSYTVRTDADLTTDIMAATIDDAARIYAEDEFPGASITDVADLFAKIEEIGDGAWCWIEGEGDAPDGERQSVGHVAGVIG